MVKITVIALIALLVAGCQTSVATYRTYPAYGSTVDIYDGPPMIMHRPLIVPHRDWIDGRCWIQRRQRWDGQWMVRRMCD